MSTIKLSEVGAHPRQDSSGQWVVTFGIYLPGITFDKGYRLKLRVIHEADQFIAGIEPRDFWMSWDNGSALDLWTAEVPLTPEPAPGHFGHEGGTCIATSCSVTDATVAFWFSDPFARASGSRHPLGLHSRQPRAAVRVDRRGIPTPEVDELVVYEVNVREFNTDFDGLTAQLDYIRGLGVNVLELMPVSNVKEVAEWGYTPLDFFAPDERLGGPLGLKRLVNAAHARGIAVILDSVYAHTHPEFTYHLVYAASGEPNPMLGRFEGEFFDWPGTDYRKAFTRDYFFELNKYLLEEYHVDGFRYDYVPGMYDGPVGQGYADLVYPHLPAFEDDRRGSRRPAGGAASSSAPSTCPDAAGILGDPLELRVAERAARSRPRHGARRLRHRAARAPARSGVPWLSERAHRERRCFPGRTVPVPRVTRPRAVHQPVRHASRCATCSASALATAIASTRCSPTSSRLYTAKGIPMLWHGQEFAENWGVPGGGLGRNLFERPLHWEFFYDEAGKALVRLHRIMGTLRRTHRALRSRGYFYYFYDQAHLAKGVLAYRRQG